MLYNERKIGKKAWLLDGTEFSGLHLNDKAEYIISAVKSAKESNDHCEHIILQGKDGKLTEVKEYNVVIAFNGDFTKYLSDNDCYADAGEDGNGNVDVFIEMGDWKHSHLWCRDLMEYIGYKEIAEDVTEEDGSDCYSSIHTFTKKAE